MWEWFDDYHATFVNNLARNGRAFALGNGITDAGQINAIEHAFTSAEIAFRYGRHTAEIFGGLKDSNWRSDPDAWKDHWNNEVGRRIAEWAEQHGYGPEVLDRLMYDALQNGQLITSENDPRIGIYDFNGDGIPETFTVPDPTWQAPSIWSPSNWGLPTDDAPQPRDYTGLPDPGLGDWLFDRLLDVLGLFVNLADLAGEMIHDVITGLAGLLRAILVDPIVLDLDGDGIELVALAGSATHFDMDDDGVAERTGWVSPHDGLLVHDANSNGIADGIGELLGSANVDGYDELATLDANQDGWINAGDAAFAQLMVWRDLNGDGEATAAEMLTLPDAGIAANDNDLLGKIAA